MLRAYHICAVILLVSGVNGFAAELQFRTLAQGGHSGIGQATNRVIQSQAEWEDFWKKAQGMVVPSPAAPSVNFETEMVLAAAMGLKSTGGYSITIRRVERTADRLKIYVVEQSPGPNDIVTQALTAPFHFVAVPRTDLRPEFVMEKKSRR
jgi:hypothetical protein